MTVKSIIEVDVQSQAFDRFKKAFDDYQHSLSNMPKAWAETAKEGKTATSSFEKMTKEMMAQHEIARESLETEKDRIGHLHSFEHLWTSIGKSSTLFAKNVLSASTTLLKWGGLIFGGLAAGSIFGIDKMASSVSDDWRSARGKGLSIGEMKSFGLNFGRVVDPESFLGQVNEMMTDPRKSWHSMGVNLNDTTAHVAMNLLEKMRARALMTPSNQLGLLDQQTGMGVGEETWRRLQQMGNSEWMAQRSHFLKDIASLNVNNPRGWTDLNNQFSRMWEQMGTATANALGTPKMTQALDQFSDAASKAWTRFLTGPAVIQGLDKMSDWLTKFSGTVDTDLFMSHVDEFVSDTGKLAEWMHELTHPGEAIADKAKAMARHPGVTLMDATVPGIGWLASIQSMFTGNTQWNRATALQHLAELDTKYKLPAGSLEYLWKQEASDRFDPGDHPGKNGAQGPFQIKPLMGNGVDLHDFAAASERAAQIVADDMKKFGSIEAGLAGFHLGDSTLMDVMNGSRRARVDWRRAIPYLSGWQGSPNAGGMTGQIGNTTLTLQANVTPGNSIVLTTNQLGGGR